MINSAEEEAERTVERLQKAIESLPEETKDKFFADIFKDKKARDLILIALLVLFEKDLKEEERLPKSALEHKDLMDRLAEYGRSKK